MDPVQALKEALGDEPDVELAVLFGSTATGRAGPTSDLDVGVLGPLAGARLTSLEVMLSRRTGRQVDLISLESAPPLLRFELTRTGQVLLERRPGAWTNFKARAMVDWWDWAPYARRFAQAAAQRLAAERDHGQA